MLEFFFIGMGERSELLFLDARKGAGEAMPTELGPM
jgi:hypothetical protein